MKVSTVIAPNPNFAAQHADSPTAMINQIELFCRRAEELGYHGIWVTDSIGRGHATVDPLHLLQAAAAVTEKVTLGTGVLQLPLRHPVELAHRVATLNLFSGGRVQLGIGAGSTEADFLTVEADYQTRFKLLPGLLETMRRTWAGEEVFGPAVTPWPTMADGPAVLLGSWHSPRWIEFAASECDGWVGSGIYGTVDDLETGLDMYRAAGGTRMVLTNIFTDLREKVDHHPLAQRSKITMLGQSKDHRDLLKRIADTGLDEVVVLPPFDQVDQLEQILELMP